MKCPACGYEFGTVPQECPRCGLIISRYKKRGIDTVAADQEGVRSNVHETCHDEKDETLLSSLLFYIKPRVDSADFGLRLVFALIISFWGVVLIFSAKDGEGGGFAFWHLVNLPFHEAGHIVFRPFGKLVTSLGGTLGQLAMPLVTLFVFLLKNRDVFAAGFSLWWFGVNFMDVAPYIGDARSLTLPLLGGNTGATSPYGFHDWEFILTETHLLSYDQVLSNVSFALGVFFILTAMVWWAVILKIYYQRIES